jgi:hypothetical protein
MSTKRRGSVVDFSYHSGIVDDEVCATQAISDVWLISWYELVRKIQVSALHIDGLAPYPNFLYLPNHQN